MPRRGEVLRRPAPHDAKYDSEAIGKLINRVMKCGQKRTAERVVYATLQVLEERTKKNPLEVLELAIKNATPALGVKPRRVAGATYQVPVEIQAERSNFLAIRWLLDAARARKGMSMAQRLAAELMDAANGTGTAVKKREDMHKMAQANRAFVHFRW